MPTLLLEGETLEYLTDAGHRVGSIRQLDEGDVKTLTDLATDYADKSSRRAKPEAFLEIGAALTSWLEAKDHRIRDFTSGRGPILLEVRAPDEPTPQQWSVLRAPWELLATSEGTKHLTFDTLRPFDVVRRLGTPTTAPDLSNYRLGVAFMAASPDGVTELDYEAEEDAILTAIPSGKVDFVVDDSGNTTHLAETLTEHEPFPVLHLSCHGTNNYQKPTDSAPVAALAMETETGEKDLVSAADLLSRLPRSAHQPQLVVVAACLTARAAIAEHSQPAQDDAPAPVSHSFASALVTGGIPAVLAWEGSVDDDAATTFSAALYEQLGRKQGLGHALAHARQTLATHTDKWQQAYWHFAQCWLGPTGGGPLTAGKKKRGIARADRGTKRSLGNKHDCPVASTAMFVGRRRELQASIAALSSGDYGGIILQGLGRNGKSSLAARVLDRHSRHKAVAIVGTFTAQQVLAELADQLQQVPAALDIIKSGSDTIRDNPDRFQSVLTQLLTGPCDQDHRVVLVLDDFEQVLEPSPDGPHRVNSQHASTVQAIINAFDPDETDSRLIITSRYTFTVNGDAPPLKVVGVPSFSETAQEKLKRRQVNAFQTSATGPMGQGEGAKRHALADRAVEISRGNPGLQDLTVERIAFNTNLEIANAERALTNMEEYLTGRNQAPDTELPQDAQDFLAKLALDALLDQAGAANTSLLRAATLFNIPVPPAALDAIAAKAGGSVANLTGLGLLETRPDPVQPGQVALAVAPLAAGKLPPLTDAEQQPLAEIALPVLLAAWSPDSGRMVPGPVALQLTRLGLLTDNPDAVAAHAARAIHELRTGLACDAAAFGEKALALLDAHQRPPAPQMLQKLADAQLTAGDGTAGDATLKRAETAAGDDVDDYTRASVSLDRGRRLLRTGNTNAAERALTEAVKLFEQRGHTRAVAIVWGDIADIHQARGDFDEALTIYTDRCLPAFEKIGDTREIALAWGRIADIHQRHGDLDMALTLYTDRCLPAFEKIGDTRHIAVTWSQIAAIHQIRGDLDMALTLYTDRCLPAFEKIGDTRSIAVTWGDIAAIHQARGDLDEALTIHTDRCLPAFEKIGDTRQIAVTWSKIADIHFRRGDLDQSLTIHTNRCLPTYENIGDTRQIAVTWSKIADIYQACGDLDMALTIYTDRCLPAYEKIGDTHQAAVTWSQIAAIHQIRGDLDMALTIHTDRCLLVFEKIGDAHHIAVTWGKIAALHQIRGDLDMALTIHTDRCLPVFEKIGDTREIAVTWSNIADIHFRRGDLDQSLTIHTNRCLPTYENIGEPLQAAATWNKIANIHFKRRNYDQAREFYAKALAVGRRMQALDTVAHCQWWLAQLDCRKCNDNSAIERLEESFECFVHLQSPSETNFVGQFYGKLLAQHGHSKRAREVFTVSIAAAQAIGDDEAVQDMTQRLHDLDTDS